MSDFDRLMGDSLKAIRDDHVREIESQIPAVRWQIATKIRGRRFTFVIGAVAVAAASVAVALFVTESVPNLDRSVPPANPDSDATVVHFPALTNTFVSPRNGFSVKHPDRAEVTPAKQLFGLSSSEQSEEGFDVVETGLAAVFKGASTVGTPTDDYLSPGGCGVPRYQQAQITIDGQPGRISECPNEIMATLVAGDRFYIFTLLHERSDARAVFDAFVATINLTPETAVELPNLTATFVSPTNGYSFKYLDRGQGSLTPATERYGFDFVESGVGAYFSAASTQIPDGVSIDERVDEYLSDLSISPGGCGVPRSQQAEITIDGQPGRIAECPNQIEATVVAGGRLYLFILEHSRTDARAFFDTWIATIDLTPETAAASR